MEARVESNPSLVLKSPNLFILRTTRNAEYATNPAFGYVAATRHQARPAMVRNRWEPDFPAKKRTPPEGLTCPGMRDIFLN